MREGRSALHVILKKAKSQFSLRIHKIDPHSLLKLISSVDNAKIEIEFGYDYGGREDR